MPPAWRYLIITCHGAFESRSPHHSTSRRRAVFISRGEDGSQTPGTKNREFAIFAEARTRITQKVRTRTKTKTLLYDDTPYCDCMKSGVCSLMGNHTKRIFFPTRRTPKTDATSPFLALLRYAKFFFPQGVEPAGWRCAITQHSIIQ